MRDHISFSEWQAFRNGCKHRWKLDYVEGHRRHVYSVHMDFGTAVHNAIELHKTRKDPLTKEAAAEDFRKKFKSLYDKNVSKYREKEREISPDFFLEAGARIITRLDECDELASAEVVFNEHKLEESISRTDDLNVRFKGFIDIVIKTKNKRGKTILYVCDFKTCSWGWNREKREDRELHAQLMLYKHFLCKKFDIDPTDVRVAFILLKKKPKASESPIEWFPISAGPKSVQRAVDELNKDVTQMKLRLIENDLPKDRTKCISPFGDRCPYMDTHLCPEPISKV